MILNEGCITYNQVLRIRNNYISSNTSINELGLEIDNRINCNLLINELCNQASKQINALKRMKHYLDKDSKNLIYNVQLCRQF